MAQHPDDVDGGAQGEERRDKGEHRREDRSEDDEEHHEGQEHAETRPADGRLVGVLGQQTRNGDLQVGPCHRGRSGHEGLGVRLAQVVGLLVERHRHERDRLVLVDLVGALSAVGAGDLRHMGERLDLPDHRVDARFYGRVGHLDPAGGGEDDLLGIARHLGRRRLQELDGVGRLGMRQRERTRVGGPHRLHQTERSDQHDRPDQEYESAMVDTPAGQGAHVESSPENWTGGDGGIASSKTLPARRTSEGSWAPTPIGHVGGGSGAPPGATEEARRRR